MEYEIIEDGTSLKLTEPQYEKVRDILYYCSECSCYHVKINFDLDVVESRIKE